MHLIIQTQISTQNSRYSQMAKNLMIWMVRRWVPITSSVFAMLVVSSLASGIPPRDLTTTQDPLALISLAMVGCGVAIRSWSAGTLRKHVELTTEGPHSLVRNPLYIGSLVMMLGFCALIGQTLLLWIATGPFLLLFLHTVKHEERTLADQFDSAWQLYASSTPRFIPHRLIVRAGRWSIGQWKKNREYQAVLAATTGLIALQFWQMR